jgi:hypothetical protein
MAIDDFVDRLSGANQYSRPHLEVQPGSTAMTHRSALAAIPARKVRKRWVGIPEMVLRKHLARRPRPRVSRPVWRASVKSRSSTTHDGATSIHPCQPKQRSDRRPYPTISGAGRQGVQVEGDGVGPSDRVSGRIQDPTGHMPCIQVHAECSASAQLVQRWRLDRLRLPGGVQVPAVPARLVADVVANRPSSCLDRPFVPSMVEGHRTCQTVGAGAPGVLERSAIGVGSRSSIHCCSG